MSSAVIFLLCFYNLVEQNNLPFKYNKKNFNLQIFTLKYTKNLIYMTRVAGLWNIKTYFPFSYVDEVFWHVWFPGLILGLKNIIRKCFLIMNTQTINLLLLKIENTKSWVRFIWIVQVILINNYNLINLRQDSTS